MLLEDVLGALESRGALGGCAWSPLLAVLVGKQNCRDGPIAAETMLFLLPKE